MSKNLPGRMLNKQATDKEWPQNDNLRPRCLANFMGQQRIKQNLKIFIDAAKQRQEALDHIIFYGPAGFGKTTLANIIAQELGVNFKPTAAPLLSKPCDIAALLTNIQPHEVLFIDEIHRLHKAIEEILYPAMEDGHLDIIAGKGPAAQSIRINIPPFTLIGATTRLGLLSKPLRDRFGINVQFEPYSNDELIQIIQNTTHNLSVTLTNDASSFLSQCSRGTPRIAIRLAKRIRDFLQTHNQTSADTATVRKILEQLGIDEEGLDQYDRKYLRFIGQHYYDTAVGIETIAAALSESCNNIEEVIEPYLIEKGFIQKTARGRILSANGKIYYSHNLLSKNL